MDIRMDDTEAIAAGIMADAEAEAASVVAEAEAYAASVGARAAEQAQLAEREAAAKAVAQAQAIRADAASKAAIERRKGSLSLQEGIAASVVARAIELVAAMRSSPGYRDVLRAWIAEAAIGLSADSATVNAAKEDLPFIDEALLREAEAEARSSTGKPVSLRKVEGDPVLGQGVYLVADGGRLAYDNRVAARLERDKTAVRRRVYEALAAAAEVKA